MQARTEARAVLNHARISSRKVKIVIDLIRNKPVGTAMAILKNTPKAASEYLIKLLNSAVANAENNFGLSPENLYVSEVFANAGPTLKRIMPRAQGRAFRILKRTSHITIVVKEMGSEKAVVTKVETADKEETTAKKKTTAKKAAEPKAKKAPAKKATTKKATKKVEETAESAE